MVENKEQLQSQMWVSFEKMEKLWNSKAGQVT